VRVGTSIEYLCGNCACNLEDNLDAKLSLWSNDEAVDHPRLERLMPLPPPSGSAAD
jgi:hypothetical protein